MGHPIIHFEIPANDPGRLKDFYTGLFGWSIEATPMPEYFSIMTKAEGPNIDGGMMKRKAPQQTHLNYVSVESVAEFAEKAKQLGGQVIMGKTAVPKMGWFAVCLDPEGNPIGLWQTDPNAA